MKDSAVIKATNTHPEETRQRRNIPCVNAKALGRTVHCRPGAGTYYVGVPTSAASPQVTGGWRRVSHGESCDTPSGRGGGLCLDTHKSTSPTQTIFLDIFILSLPVFTPFPNPPNIIKYTQ